MTLARYRTQTAQSKDGRSIQADIAGLAIYNATEQIAGHRLQVRIASNKNSGTSLMPYKLPLAL